MGQPPTRVQVYVMIAAFAVFITVYTIWISGFVQALMAAALP